MNRMKRVAQARDKEIEAQRAAQIAAEGGEPAAEGSEAGEPPAIAS